MKQPAELTLAEARLLAAYRIMDRRAKESTWLYANMQAREHPEPPPRPRLQVMAGGMSKPTKRRCKAPELHLVLCQTQQSQGRG